MCDQRHWRLAYIVNVMLFIGVFCYFAKASFSYPSLFNPDDLMNRAATSYLAEHRSLPIVDSANAEIRFTELGTTRSLRPPLTYIVSASTEVLLGDLVPNSAIGQNLGASLLGSLTIALVFSGLFLAYRSVLAALCGALLLALLPRFLILSSSNNDDIGAVFAGSLLFTSLLIVHRNPQKMASYFTAAVAIGLVFIAKFTAWICLPVAFLYLLVKARRQWRSLLPMAPILLMTVVLAGGWWPLFNMWHYGASDPTAIKHAVALQEQLTQVQANRRGFFTLGLSYFGTLINWSMVWQPSLASIVGDLGWLGIKQSAAIKILYALVLIFAFLAACLAFFKKPRENYFVGLVLFLILIQIIIFIHHLWLRDMQVDGRYLLPVAMPILYLFTSGVNQWRSVTIPPQALRPTTVVLISLMMLLGVLHIFAIQSRYLDSFEQPAFNSKLLRPKTVSIPTLFTQAAATGLKVFLDDARLTLQRDDSARLDAYAQISGLCELLHINSVLHLRLDSISPGSIGFATLDSSGQLQDQSWHAIQFGENSILLTSKGLDCQSTRFYLGRQTHKVTVSELRIYSLRVHRYGEPVL